MGASLSKDGWSPVALSTDLPPGGVMRADVAGFDMVVWRGRSGRVHAWDNRCPHRGMRLSFGFVRGDRLACLYHGWQYGEDAACRYIPAHPDLEPPQSICATPYPCAEIDGLIWASAPEGGIQEGGVPEGPDHGSEPVRSIAINATPEPIAALLGDGGFPILEPECGDGNQYRRTVDETLYVVVEGKAGDQSRTLVAALQPLQGGRTMLHLQTSPKASVGLKVQLSRWAERIRWFAENEVSPNACAQQLTQEEDQRP